MSSSTWWPRSWSGPAGRPEPGDDLAGREESALTTPKPNRSGRTPVLDLEPATLEVARLLDGVR